MIAKCNHEIKSQNKIKEQNLSEPMTEQAKRQLANICNIPYFNLVFLSAKYLTEKTGNCITLTV